MRIRTNKTVLWGLYLGVRDCHREEVDTDAGVAKHEQRRPYHTAQQGLPHKYSKIKNFDYKSWEGMLKFPVYE